MLTQPIKLTTVILLILTGCDGSTQIDTPISELNTGIQIAAPVKIRESLAIDIDQVVGTVNVNGITKVMDQSGTTFSVVFDVPAESVAQVSLNFKENFNGSQLDLAEITPFEVTIGDANETHQILQQNYSYSFDDDGDGTSNIFERNNGTDPTTSELAVTTTPAVFRSITVQFNIPKQIADPFITQTTALILDIPRQLLDPQEDFAIIARAQPIPSDTPISIDIRLSQKYTGPNAINQNNPQTVIVAQALEAVPAGTEDRVIPLSDDDFSFLLDSDEDGVNNLDEMQAGTNPFGN